MTTENLKNVENDEFELKATCINNSDIKKPWTANLVYAFIGMLFGIVFVKAEIVSWFRIQEMFRFESFHMYGVIGTAVVVGMISVFIIKKFNIKTLDGEQVILTPKTNSKLIRRGKTVGWKTQRCSQSMSNKKSRRIHNCHACGVFHDQIAVCGR